MGETVGKIDRGSKEKAKDPSEMGASPTKEAKHEHVITPFKLK